MTEKMQTVCAGRMLIDLPAEAQYSFFGEKISGFSIGASKESAEAFNARLAQREAEIRAKPDRLGGDDNLEMVREVHTASGLAGKVFMHGRVVTEGGAYTPTGERQYRYEDVTLEAHVHGDGVGIDVIAKEASPQRIETLFKLVSQLVANPANSIPTESGFCLDRAYVRDPLTAKNRERIVMTAGLPSRPDIEIKFDTTAGTKPGRGTARAGCRLPRAGAPDHQRTLHEVARRATHGRWPDR